MKASVNNQLWQLHSINLKVIHAKKYLAFSIRNLSANKASKDYHAVFSRLQREKRSLFQNMICCAEAESLAS